MTANGFDLAWPLRIDRNARLDWYRYEREGRRAALTYALVPTSYANDPDVQRCIGCVHMTALRPPICQPCRTEHNLNLEK